MPEVAVNRDNLAGFYDSRYDGGYMEEHVGLGYERVLDTLGMAPKGATSILDFGCGQGAWTRALSETFPDAKITGVDISMNALRRARKRHAGHGHVLYDGCRAPFRDGCFGFVFSFHVLEHVYDVDAAIGEVSRLLKPGGHALIIMPCGNAGSFEERLVRLVRNGREATPDGGTRFYYEDPGHLRRLTSGEVLEKFAAHGLEPVGQRFSNQFWGAVEWITAPGGVTPEEMFPYSRGANLAARIGLMALLTAFNAVYYARRLAMCDLKGKIAGSGGLVKKVLLASLAPFKYLLAPLDRAFVRLARREWETGSLKANGSAQMLLLRKGQG